MHPSPPPYLSPSISLLLLPLIQGSGSHESKRTRRHDFKPVKEQNNIYIVYGIHYLLIVCRCSLVLHRLRLCLDGNLISTYLLYQIMLMFVCCLCSCLLPWLYENTSCPLCKTTINQRRRAGEYTSLMPGETSHVWYVQANIVPATNRKNAGFVWLTEDNWIEDVDTRLLCRLLHVNFLS